MNLVEFSTRRRVTVAMMAVTMVLFGWIGWTNLKVNLLPELTYPTLTVRTEYIGAAPAEIETLITQPIEESVGVVKGLTKLKSVSRAGQSDIVLEFAWGSDMDKASLDVRDKLDTLRLPLDVTPPVLLRFNPTTEPILRLVMSVSDKDSKNQAAELMRLRRYAEETLKKRLEPVDGVAAVKVGGGFEDQIQVQLDTQKLSQLNLPASLVIDRLRQENINISGGRIEEGSERYLVRTVNQFSNLEQMKNLLITTQDNVPVRLKDVAVVEQGYKEREAIIRMQGRESVELAIYKEGDGNTVAVANAVNATLERLQNANRDPKSPKIVSKVAGAYTIDGYSINTIDDQSKFIKSALNEVKFEALMGGFFSILIIFFFLRDGWSTFVISLSLPVSIISTFFFMDMLGLSLNVMSMAGLALATGMVVDDSIVVLESIAKARERGLGLIEATIKGASEVSMAVVASTLTTIAVFFPLVFVEGIAGQLFKDQALTVSIALAISLIVSLTLIPMLSSIKAVSKMAFAADEVVVREPPVGRVSRFFYFSFEFIKKIVGWLVFQISFVVTAIFRFLAKYVGGSLAWLGEKILMPYEAAASYYHKILPKVLDRPAMILSGSFFAFVIAIFVALSLGTDLIPQLAQDRFEMTAKLAPGTQLRETDGLVQKIQKAYNDDSGIEKLYGVSGSGTRLDANPTESGDNVAKLTVILGDKYTREAEAAITERMRKTMQAYPDVQVKFARPQLLSFATPLEIELSGQDLASIEKAGRQLSELMKKSPHFADVKSSVEQGYPEVQIIFDQERAAALGLTSRQIADQVVRQVRGEVATRYSFRDRKIDVLVRAREVDRSSIDDIRNIIINPQSDSPVPLSAVANVVETVGPSEINRADQTRVALVSANLRDIDLGTAVQEVKNLVQENPIGTDVKMTFGGQSEDLDRSINSLIFAFGLAMFLVYLVMASQFESLLHPFVIMFSVPLAIVGAVLALWVKGSPISIVVFIGLILLVGIVVKNAIVLLDKVNQLREEGVNKREAICRGAESRLRPIIMTTLTTLFGFAPLAFFGGDGAEIRAPMAITVIGGLTVSTILTLVIIPIVYNILDRRTDDYYRERGIRAATKFALQAQESSK
ncbi:MAG: efflux RND transporter permease subunit [Arenimonas sp.]|nr:efflux RND transporter permease subunit [Arenimonas sp.]MBP6309056.1 efflux RND transporter permease subunit [Arenimonas sp.]